MSGSLDNALVGFLLCLSAGLATALGAGAVYFARVVQLSSPRVLACGLALAAGVMLYISFVEIFYKAVGGFYDAELERLSKPSGSDDYSDPQKERAEKQAVWRAYVTFLCGVLLMMLLDHLVHRVTEEKTTQEKSASTAQEANGKSKAEVENVAAVAVSVAGDGAVAQKNAEVSPSSATTDAASMPLSRTSLQQLEDVVGRDAMEKGAHLVEMAPRPGKEVKQNSPLKDHPDGTGTSEGDSNQEEEEKLLLMATKTALAIALHNFPEGLATFIATLSDVHVGVALAFGIAIHNIPEGLCVSIPVYYSSRGNRHRAFLLGAASGLSEPIAALVCWAVLGSLATVDGTIYGVLFGLVAGMMVYISLHELLPTAIRYDPKDEVVTKSWLAGAAIIGLSLIVLLPDGAEM